MNLVNNKKFYLYEYLIIFLIYIRNTVKYFFGFKLNKNKQLAKIYPIINNNPIIDEEYGSNNYNDSIDSVFVFNESGRIINHYSIKSKDKLD